MLSKRRRLTSAEVRGVIARGRGRRGEVLSTKVLANEKPFRCAVIVSKKVARSAVKRNQLRRAVYGALERTPLPPTGHVILFVLSVPPEKTATVFALEIKKLLHV